MDNDNDDMLEIVECQLSDDDENNDSSEVKTAVNECSTNSLESLPNIFERPKIEGMPYTEKLKYIRRPTKPVRLFSFSDKLLSTRFSTPNETTRNIVLQLLDMVKKINSQRRMTVANGAIIPNYYLIPTKCEHRTSHKLMELETKDIVNLIKDIVQMIKITIYRDVDYVELICDSPAIFFVKHVHVKNWNTDSNAVFVVTSEYLSPYWCKVQAAVEQEERDKKGKQLDAVMKNVAKVPSPLSSNKPKRRSMNLSKEVTKKKKIVTEESPDNVQSDIEKVECILKRYLEPEAIHFMRIQMKVAGKKFNQYRWKDEDKIFALKLLRNNPSEYCLLFQNYTLPSDKTLEKFVGRMQDIKITNMKTEKS